MSEDIKNTAIPAAGYVYQTRQGLRVLCDWLDAPTRYGRLKFECDDETEAPTGLDDIVVERSDDLVDLQQVKFTPNPDAYPLCWEWLLEKTGKTAKSRSMLRKWFDAFRKLDPARIGEISLVTNRRPDADIEACLEAGKISFAKVATPWREKVIAELKTEQDCDQFFSLLNIRHSDKGYERLEHEVDARLRAHGTAEGIANLKNVALNWATQKNRPAPDGWITLGAVRTILQATPPTPLLEDFDVPAGYEVPDATFHAEFLEDAIASSGKTLVLKGPPGRGKSTYLSALREDLAERGVPTIRHHYFLSTTERGRDRVHCHVVEQSIQAQVKDLYPDVPNMGGGLRALLEACAAHYKERGKPIVLILDGLDHVWRVNAGDKRPLDDLFSQVLPCPDNLVLLVGTQPVDDAQLPNDLLVAAPKSQWRELPAMSEDAVLSYLCKAIDEGRLSTNGANSAAGVDEEVQRAATELRARTNGHPLHVIYATAELEHGDRVLSKWNVEQLKGDLTADAKTYYGSLWVTLPPSLKTALCLVCAFPFFWPSSAFGQIAEATKNSLPEVQKVHHLLHSSAAGLKVFHESLAVYVRATDDYEERIKQLTPEVAQWLETSAPIALRVNWLWTIQARLGAPQNLISGLTRDWIMQRLEEGYPESLFETLLTEALAAALGTGAFADAYRLAHLESRMVGGSQFQMEDDDMARLVAFTLTLAADEGVVKEAIASRHETDILKVAALGLALDARGNRLEAKMCGDEALRRYRGQSRFSRGYGGTGGFKFLATAFAQLGVIAETADELTQSVTYNSPVSWLPRVQMLVKEGNLDDLMAVTALLPDGESKSTISNACIRAAATAGVSIAARPDFGSLARTPLVAAVEAAHARVSKPLTGEIPVDWLKGDYYQRKEDLAALMHQWFFRAVHLGLSMAAEGKTEFEFPKAPTYKDRENITTFLDALSGIAAQVAHHWWRGEFVDFHDLYELLAPVPTSRFRQSYDWTSSSEDFRGGLHRIACDIRLGSILLDNFQDVSLSVDTMAEAAKYAWFDSALFREQYAAGSLTPMANDAAESFIQTQRARLDADVQHETSVHLQTPLQLCAIALGHGLKPAARELCRQTWELTTGYSHRKDPTLGNTVQAISYLVEAAPDDARRLLVRIAPQVHRVLDYTDGKGTRYVLSEADELLAKLGPSALVVKYAEHTDAGDWSQAEDSLQAYVAQGVKDGWPLDALMRTGMQAEIRDALVPLAKHGNARAVEMLRALDGQNGWEMGLLQKESHRSTSTEGKPYAGDVKTFEPEQLQALLDDLSDSYGERNQRLRDWYQHWDATGHGKRLLDALDVLLLSEAWRQRDVLVLSDLAFETRRKLSGPKAAWKYLVNAQIHRGGWIGNLAESQAKTRARLDLVIQHFAGRCDEFVNATAYSMFGEPPERIAPAEVMVYFYAQQGRIPEAVKFAEAMVDCVIEDTRTLPLAPPRWAAELAAPVTPAA